VCWFSFWWVGNQGFHDDQEAGYWRKDLKALGVGTVVIWDAFPAFVHFVVAERAAQRSVGGPSVPRFEM